MKIEVIANGRGSVTIKSDGEYTKAELLALARGAEALTEKLVAAVAPRPRLGFGMPEGGAE
ncbi:hypothetical protein [Umezawaea sp. NPDC059074]|uniref:hypothetical protein n=1 Tax=Umezawaea sp. NPDC059074 TaxID=3346716 RepID=UPI0036AE98DF